MDAECEARAQRVKQDGVLQTGAGNSPAPVIEHLRSTELSRAGGDERAWMKRTSARQAGLFASQLLRTVRAVCAAAAGGCAAATSVESGRGKAAAISRSQTSSCCTFGIVTYISGHTK